MKKIKLFYKFGTFTVPTSAVKLAGFSDLGIALMCDATHTGIHYIRSVCRLVETYQSIIYNLCVDVCFLIGWTLDWLVTAQSLSFYYILHNPYFGELIN